MADVLDQSEVDALLRAVADGGIDTDDSEEGIGGLDSSSKANEKQREIHAYDFKRPERVSKDQEMALQGVHERFARNLGAALSSYLRTIIEVKVRSTEQLTFAEFTYSLPVPTSFSLLSASPLEGEMCLEISPLIIFPIIDRMLGGGNAELYVPQRPLTQIEQRLANRILERALDALAEAWSNIADVTFEITQTESNPQLVQIVAPNEVVVVIAFEIKMGNRAGSMSLCIPFNVIEPVMGRLTSQDWFGQNQSSSLEDRRESLMENLGEAKLKMRAFLAETTINMHELLNLQVGDIIETEKESKNELILQIEGESKFAGRAGQFRGNRAFRVTRKSKVKEKI
ncbi:MAG: flagellar motor switch protein FliM [Sedimentisphaerales bacterium]|nr:flagellar motor switch protein FliM [Sedimentisphaerales bacterium]